MPLSLSLKSRERTLLHNVINIVCGHEFRTPMNAIVGFASIMKQADTRDHGQERNEYAQYIMEASSRLMLLSERLHIWHRLYNGESFEKDNITIDESIFNKIITDIAKTFPKVNYIISFCADFHHFELKASCLLVAQTIKELTDNAFKFSIPGTMVHFEVTITEGNINLKITNHSEITTVKQLKGYESFNQFNRNQFEQQGLGLGMDIARFAISAANGSIQIDGVDYEHYSKIAVSIQIPACSD